MLTVGALATVLIISAMSAPPITYTFILGQQVYTNTYTITTNSLYVHAEMALTPRFSSILMVLQNTNSMLSTNRNNWLHIDPSIHTKFDYQGLVSGNNQYAWIANPGIASTITIKIINFQSFSQSFSITITQSNSFIKSCLATSGINNLPINQYCSSCLTNCFKPFCTIPKISVSQQEKISTIVSPKGYLNVVIISKKKLTLYLTYSNTVYVFIQTKTFQDELAGMVNYFSDNAGKTGKLSFSGSGQVKLSIDSTGQHLLIGIINKETSALAIGLYYVEQQQAVNLIIIIISVLGGVLIVCLIIIGICLIRKYRRQTRAIIHAEVIFRRQPLRPQQLNAEEIDIYFPEFPLSFILSRHLIEKTIEELNKQQTSSQHECVICLCPIEPSETVRAGYCKHIFHSTCLTQWFTKQFNCPYCRKGYSKSQTKESYSKFKKQKTTELKGNDIIVQIFRLRPDESIQTLIVQEIENIP